VESNVEVGYCANEIHMVSYMIQGVHTSCLSSFFLTCEDVVSSASSSPGRYKVCSSDSSVASSAPPRGIFDNFDIPNKSERVFDSDETDNVFLWKEAPFAICKKSDGTAKSRLKERNDLMFL
jgi:hypothetical protein